MPFGSVEKRQHLFCGEARGYIRLIIEHTTTIKKSSCMRISSHIYRPTATTTAATPQQNHIPYPRDNYLTTLLTTGENTHPFLRSPSLLISKLANIRISPILCNTINVHQRRHTQPSLKHATQPLIFTHINRPATMVVNECDVDDVW